MPESNAHHHTENIIRENVQKVGAFWREIALVCGGVALVGIIYAVLSHQTQVREHDAGIAFAKALMITDQTARHTAMEKVISNYPGTSAAMESRIALIATTFQDAITDATKRENVTKMCEAFIAENPNSFFTPKVRCDYARILEWSQAWDKALAQYELAEKSNQAYILPTALLGKGRCLELLKKPDEARKAYQQILDMQQESPFENEYAFNHPMSVTKAARFGLMLLSKGVEPLSDAKLEAALKPATPEPAPKVVPAATPSDEEMKKAEADLKATIDNELKTKTAAASVKTEPELENTATKGTTETEEDARSHRRSRRSDD